MLNFNTKSIKSKNSKILRIQIEGITELIEMYEIVHNKITSKS